MIVVVASAGRLKSVGVSVSDRGETRSIRIGIVTVGGWMLLINISRKADEITALGGTSVKGKSRNARDSRSVTGSIPANTLCTIGVMPCVTIKTPGEFCAISPSIAESLRID